jgi:hypothetical protein
VRTRAQGNRRTSAADVMEFSNNIALGVPESEKAE